MSGATSRECTTHRIVFGFSFLGRFLVSRRTRTLMSTSVYVFILFDFCFGGGTTSLYFVFSFTRNVLQSAVRIHSCSDLLAENPILLVFHYYFFFMYFVDELLLRWLDQRAAAIITAQFFHFFRAIKQFMLSIVSLVCQK